MSDLQEKTLQFIKSRGLSGAKLPREPRLQLLLAVRSLQLKEYIEFGQDGLWRVKNEN